MLCTVITEYEHQIHWMVVFKKSFYHHHPHSHPHHGQPAHNVSILSSNTQVGLKGFVHITHTGYMIDKDGKMRIEN